MEKKLFLLSCCKNEKPSSSPVRGGGGGEAGAGERYMLEPGNGKLSCTY